MRGREARPLRFRFCQRADSRRVDRLAADVEHRSVTRAIPAGLEAVPVQMAADMRASGGIEIQRALVVAIGGNLLQPTAHDCALSRLQLIKRCKLARCEILR